PIYNCEENSFVSDNLIIVSDRVMNKISAATSPSGILGVFSIPPHNINPIVPPGIVLVNIADPGNMGTLIRTAAAVHITTVIIVGGADCFGPKVIQATAGTIAKVSLYILSWQELMLQKNNIPLCALI